jgi:anti-sigma factor RsiW
MNKPTPSITDEHIVAWLDGELPLTPTTEIEASLAASPELAHVAAEYTALDTAFSRSRGDQRFALPKAVDSRVRAALASEISRSRKTVRMPERAPMAAPVPGSTTIVRTKSLWARRSAYALALALFAIFGWFIGNSGQKVVEVAVNTPATPTPSTQTVTTPAPNASSVAEPTATTQAAAASIREHAPSHTQTAPLAAVQNNQVNTTTQNPTAATAVKQTTPAPAEENDPAAAMASHRYAKLIKATQAVVITSQDQL